MKQIFGNSSNTKFHQNPSSVSRVIPCRQTDGETDMTKLIVAFRHVANAPNNRLIHMLNAPMGHFSSTPHNFPIFPLSAYIKLHGSQKMRSFFPPSSLTVVLTHFRAREGTVAYRFAFFCVSGMSKQIFKTFYARIFSGVLNPLA
jgi:hypothetical protein